MGIFSRGRSIFNRRSEDTEPQKTKPSHRRNNNNQPPGDAPPIVDEPHVIVEAPSKDRLLFDKFIEEYDPDGSLEFNDIQFRKGAPITGVFGLDNGFKHINGKMEWGFVRLHSGVDRARGGSETFDWGTVDDIVKVPFDANRTFIHEYGDRSYGTLVRLYNDTYGFEVRIAHMNPDQRNRKQNEQGPLLEWSYKRLKKGQAFNRNWVLGSAGSWGYSSGAHTHTEIKSLDESAEVLDILLEEKFGAEAIRDYDSEEVIELYRKQSHYVSASSDKILADYAELRKEKKVILLNGYKCQYTDWDGTVKTRYSSQMLFNGM